MSSPSPTHEAPSGQPSRIEAARIRALSARRGLSVVAVASFGVSLVLVRASHPAAAHGHSSSALSAPAALVAEVQTSSLGGGSIASASGPAAVSTSTS